MFLLPYLKVPELKDILKEYKLKLGGNKPELIERVKTNIDENAELPSICSNFKGNEIIGERNIFYTFINQLFH